MSGHRKFVFSLTESQAEAMIQTIIQLEAIGIKKSSPLSKIADSLDEQMAKQKAKWEKCDKCGGSGWVEE